MVLASQARHGQEPSRLTAVEGGESDQENVKAEFSSEMSSLLDFFYKINF